MSSELSWTKFALKGAGSASDNFIFFLANGDFGENFTIPKIEPLYIDEIVIQRGNDFRANFKNLLVTGPSQFVLKNMR